MRFERLLYRNQIPQWSSVYLDYGKAKVLFKTALLSAREKRTKVNFGELFRFLELDIRVIEHFYRKQSDAINQRLTSDLGRHGIQLKDVRQYWEKADPKEAKIILGCIIETCEALEHVLWYGKVNRDAFLRVMAKIECSSGEHVPERSVFDTLLRDASFASQKRCLADLTQVIDVLSRLQLETGHHTPGDHPLFLKEAFVYCNYTEKLQVLYSAILRDDVSEMTKFLRSCQYVVDSKCRPNSVLLDLLEYSVLQGAERCAAYLTVEVNDTQSQKADLGSGNLLHRLVIKKGRLLRFRHRAGEVICNDIGKADTEIVKGRDAVAYVVQKLSSKERTMLQQKDAFGRLPLHYAVEYGLSELCLTIMRLIDRSDLVYSSDADGITPLHLAVISNSTLTTKTLLDPWAQSTGQILDPTFERVINSCLIEAVNLDYPEVSLMLISHGADLNYRNASGATPLFYAARNGSEQLTKALLERLTQAKLAVDSREDVRGWSPLLVACVEGHLPVVELLLKAGADPKLRDVFGWTAKEHAVFRGHMRIAQLLPPLDFRYSQIEIQALLGTHRSFSRRYSTGIPLGNVVPSQTVGISNKTRILVTLGPLNTRKKVTAVDLSPNRHKRAHGLRPELRYALQITAVAASGTSQLFDLPILRDVTNEPLHFETGDADSVRLIFNLYRIIDYADETEDGKNLVGRGIALLNSLRDTLGSKHESLYRDYTIPIMNTKSLEHMGNVTFGFIMITPFVHKSCRPSARQGFWEPEKGTQVIGHRGSGANTSAKTNLQIGENTVQSFLTAHALGASCVEFDVQLSKDFQTVIFHDFLVMATGGNVPLQTLTLDQFMHFGTLQSPRGDLSSIAEARYTGKMKEHSSKVGRPRSLSLNEYDEGRSEDTVNRMRYTEEGIHNDIKGNLRGHSIHEPGSTLEQLLTELPDRIAFNLEIKYPMLWEAQDRDIDPYAFELNTYVQKILNTLYDLKGNRNITFSSFSPEICILLALKQQDHPIIFINKAGSVPTGDKRAANTQQAIQFAKFWGLAGIVMLSDPFVMCPRLVGYAKNAGLITGSYGNLNDDPGCATIQAEAGLDAIIVNKVRLISETLAGVKRRLGTASKS